MPLCSRRIRAVEELILAVTEGISKVQLSHAVRAGRARFDDPALVSAAGLVAGMVAGADSIEDMDLLRHGGMGRLFTGTYAPSTLGSFLRSFAFGHVRQLDAVAARLVADLAARAPLLPDAARIAYLDVDDTIRATYGYAKQGAGYGYSGVKGLNALIAALSTPASAPVIVATRLRKGSANSARGTRFTHVEHGVFFDQFWADGPNREEGSRGLVEALGSYLG